MSAYHVEPLRLGATGKVLVGLGDAGSMLKVWDLYPLSERLHFQASKRTLEHIVSNEDASRIVTAAHFDGEQTISEIRVWDGQGELSWELKEPGVITRLALSPDGNQLVVAYAVDAENPSEANDEASSLAQAMLAKRIPPASVLRLFDAATGKAIASFDAVQDQWLGICFDREGKRVAAAGVTRSIVIWHPKTGDHIDSKHGPRNARDLCFNPAGDRLAVISKLQTKILSTDSCEEMLALQSKAQSSPESRISAPRVRWSHDGRSLAVSSHSLSVWHVPAEDGSLPSQYDISQAATRRAISYRLCRAHRKAYFGLANQAQSELKSLSKVKLNSPEQYRIRADIYTRLGDTERASADLRTAENLER